MTSDEFSSAFEQLTGHPPFRWQQRLFAQLCTGEIPARCDIPTGLGKTSVLALWLLALAEQASRPGGAVTLPRRLAYIVDRRVVVDQATTEAEKMRAALADPALAAVADALRGLAADPKGSPFELSTLRGRLADNRRWSRDPARPAIIIGTVDMVASRLLFSGYGGLGRYGRSQHAALLGQDALIVLDEAQLAPALMTTLNEVEHRTRPGTGELARPFAVMSLTATQPQQFARPDPDEPAKSTFRLQDEDFLDDEVRRRVHAPKQLCLHRPEPGGPAGKNDQDALAPSMAAAAVELAGTEGAVVVFTDRVSTLNKVHAALTATHKVPVGHCLRFNGQMRGHERDSTFSDGRGRDDASLSPERSAQREIFQVFRQPHPRTGRGYPVFLLATSAGEVGFNFDADHAVCDLVPLERMAQRIGRVNRFGRSGETARIRVFLAVPPDDLPRPELKATHRLLTLLPAFTTPDGEEVAETFSASPQALGNLLKEPAATAAYTPAAPPPPLDDARLDDWSLTSLSQEEFRRPQVSYWLRGVAPADDQAVTQLVWREELSHARDGKDAADMLETVPPTPGEVVQLPTYRAVQWLVARARKYLAARRPADGSDPGGFAAVRVAGEWDSWPLDRFEDKDRFERDLAGTTVVLPVIFGGLTRDGLPDEACDGKAEDVLEAANPTTPPGQRTYRRALLRESSSGGWEAFALSADPGVKPFVTRDSYAEIVGALAKISGERDAGRHYRLLSRRKELESDDEGAGARPDRVEYFVATGADVEAPDDSDQASLRAKEVNLADHLEATRSEAGRIVSRLRLPEPIGRAVVQAAAWHDLGKNRDKWQRAVGNTHPSRPLAKSATPRFDHRWTEGYRHEFGSLMEAIETLAQPEHRDLAERDLVLHLIAAHHGHGRPGFEEKAYDVPRYSRRQCRAAAEGAELRFERLQRRFGWWGLAYLEALVKCADGLASDLAERAATPSPADPASNP